MAIDIILRITVYLFIFTGIKFTVQSEQDVVFWRSKRENNVNYATCGSKVPGTNLLQCHCDELCTYYKDCCYGYAFNGANKKTTTDLKGRVHRTECSNFPGDPQSFLMHNVAFARPRIPASATRFIEPCQNPNKTNPFESLPVYSFRVNAHFRNDMCLQIYLKLIKTNYNTEPMAVWSVALTADCFQKYLNKFQTRGQYGTYMEFLALVFSRKHCNISLVPPEEPTTRICFQQDVEGCKDKDVCQSYQSPVVDSTGKMYKNLQCAECSGTHVMSNLEGDVDDRKTLLTLFHLSMRFEPYMTLLLLGYDPFDTCELPVGLQLMSPTSLGCNLTCPSQQMRYFNKCIDPIAKVRGFLRQIEVRTRGSKTLPNDQETKEKISRFVLDMIDTHVDLYVISKLKIVKTANSDCINIVNVTIYLRYDVTYQDFLNISTRVKGSIGNQNKELENEMLNMTLNGEPCLAVRTSYGDRSLVKRQASMTDMIRVIIFSAVFGVFVFAAVVVTVIKFMNKLAPNRETQIDENTETNF